jgi:hypothetical protein
MDDLAPAPAQRASDDVGWTPEQSLAARKKAAKKVQPAPAKKQEPVPEPDLTPEPEPDHQLDLLA